MAAAANLEQKYTEQEPMIRSTQLHYIPIHIFRPNLTGMRLPSEWHDQPRETNHVTASLNRNCLSFTKEEVY